MAAAAFVAGAGDFVGAYVGNYPRDPRDLPR